MRYYFKLEMKRAFYNRYMVIVLLIGCAISVWHFWEYVWPIRMYVGMGEYPLSSFNKWMGGEDYSLQPNIYFMLLPLLTALPYGSTWLFDQTTGYGNQVIVRHGQKAYIHVKYLVTFISGAVVAILPLLFDFILTNLVLPATCPQRGLGLSAIGGTECMAEYFYMHPLLYVIIYIIIDGIFLGLFTTLSFVAANYLRNHFIVKIVPFLIYFFLYCIGTTIEGEDGALLFRSMCPAGFLRPTQYFPIEWSWIIGEAAFMLVVGIMILHRSEKQEMGLI